MAGREDLYLRYMFRKGGARPDAVAEEAQREYLRTYTQPGAMRAGFNYYRAMSQDAKDNMAFLKQGKLQMPILVYGGGAANVVSVAGVSAVACGAVPHAVSHRASRPSRGSPKKAISSPRFSCSPLAAKTRASMRFRPYQNRPYPG